MSHQFDVLRGRSPSLPLTLTLSEGEPLELVRWLRVLPGKRYVAQGRWCGREVLAKLFVGPRANHKAQLELEGIRRLNQAAIATPALENHGHNDAVGGAWVLTEFLTGSTNLYAAAGLTVDESPETEEGPALAQQAQQLVAEMHRAGLVQQDLHPGNCLLRGGENWLVDAADVIEASETSDCLDNLGLFWAQLPECWWLELWAKYQQITQFTADYDTVCAAAWRWKAHRAQDLARKSVRDCSLFEVSTSWSRISAVWREESDTLQPLLRDLDGALAQSTLLKDGGSATVGLLNWHGRNLVIKRYNLKSLGHRLKRFWRPTRAWHSWQAGHRLRVLGIPTPRPVAMIEERFGPLRGRGYLLVEAVEGYDLLDACRQADEGELMKMSEAISELMQRMARYRVSHGDFKATNLLWQDRLQLIDLDAVRWHDSDASWQAAFRKDQARLLRNWQAGSRPYQYFNELGTEFLTDAR